MHNQYIIPLYYLGVFAVNLARLESTDAALITGGVLTVIEGFVIFKNYHDWSSKVELFVSRAEIQA
jgi:positive regulator of sigma E activity